MSTRSELVETLCEIAQTVDPTGFRSVVVKHAASMLETLSDPAERVMAAAQLLTTELVLAAVIQERPEEVLRSTTDHTINAIRRGTDPSLHAEAIALGQAARRAGHVVNRKEDGTFDRRRPRQGDDPSPAHEVRRAHPSAAG